MLAADRELLCRARHNDTAFEVLQKRFSREVFAIIKNNCKSQDFEDVIQEFYLNLLRYETEVRDVEAYIKRCAYTVAKGYYRKRAGREKFLEGEVMDRIYLYKGPQINVVKHVVSLPEKYADLLLAIYFYHQTIVRYADIAGINYNTAKIRHKRALELLRKELGWN